MKSMRNETPRAIAKRFLTRAERLKDKLISMKYQAEEAGLDDLAEELTNAFMQMDEVIAEAERAISPTN